MPKAARSALALRFISACCRMPARGRPSRKAWKTLRTSATTGFMARRMAAKSLSSGFASARGTLRTTSRRASVSAWFRTARAVKNFRDRRSVRSWKMSLPGAIRSAACWCMLCVARAPRGPRLVLGRRRAEARHDVVAEVHPGHEAEQGRERERRLDEAPRAGRAVSCGRRRTASGGPGCTGMLPSKGYAVTARRGPIGRSSGGRGVGFVTPGRWATHPVSGYGRSIFQAFSAIHCAISARNSCSVNPRAASAAPTAGSARRHASSLRRCAAPPALRRGGRCAGARCRG